MDSRRILLRTSFDTASCSILFLAIGLPPCGPGSGVLAHPRGRFFIRRLHCTTNIVFVTILYGYFMVKSLALYGVRNDQLPDTGGRLKCSPWSTSGTSLKRCVHDGFSHRLSWPRRPALITALSLISSETKLNPTSARSASSPRPST